jgi:menaquinol-cytochrome c reductase cytochrome b subunit
LLTLLSVEVAVLVVTGIALFFVYRPSVGQAWSDVAGVSERWDVRMSAALRFVHRFASGLALPTSLALGIVVALRPAGNRRWTGPALGAGLTVTAVLAAFTGYLLPWDQLALWAVRVGTNLSGYRPLFDPDTVRFVLLDGTEVGRVTVVRWLIVHAAVLGPALLVLLGLAWRRGAGPADSVDARAHLSPRPPPRVGGRDSGR